MTDYQIQITEIAQQEIFDIGHYINKQYQSPTARKTITAILNGTKRLNYSSASYSFIRDRFETDQLDNDYQYFMPYKQYLAIFYIDRSENTVYVTHVLTKGQNVMNLFPENQDPK
ncbi:hypothetical protein AB3K25_02160 [Leuconostoc sp. MS02]|uniref:Type II toxin-antitoxin system RelE/ParE family toxin n=1 Tax=Leuconostoc aquikimchii TaxID=3236804 RepID=A0ABV3S6F9_9LACO